MSFIILSIGADTSGVVETVETHTLFPANETTVYETREEANTYLSKYLTDFWTKFAAPIDISNNIGTTGRLTIRGDDGHAIYQIVEA